ncbi:MAG: hypothetical protein LBF57_02720 [Holosporaceae bacterium]|jgi:hypothetical protein|nr:hypothetical protein [Holosporaceae bacterium]
MGLVIVENNVTMHPAIDRGEIKMKKVLCIFFVSLVFCCDAMNDVEESFSDELVNQLKNWKLQHDAISVKNRITNLETCARQLKQAKKGTLSSLLRDSLVELQEVVNFLALVSSGDACLDELDDDVLEKLSANSCNRIEDFAEIYQQRKSKKDFSGVNRQTLETIEALLSPQ